MRSGSVWAMALGVEQTVVERVQWDEVERAIVAHVRPKSTRRSRCWRCECRSPRYDEDAGRRRWRVLDLGFVKAYVEADAPRVACRRYGVTVVHVPWARHNTWFTRAFDDTVA